MPAIHCSEELEQKAAALIRGCHILAVPMLITQQYTKGLGETVPLIKNALGDFDPIEKTAFSCCKEESFKDALYKTDRKSIIVTGVEAHICVQQTVLELLEDEYSVYVVADCTGSRTETDYRIALRRMEQAGAILTTMESILFEMLESADHPKRKEISNIVK